MSISDNKEIKSIKIKDMIKNVKKKHYYIFFHIPEDKTETLVFNK